MKIYRSGGTTRVWFEDLAEIDSIMEDELMRAGLYPDSSFPVVDVEAFVEQHLGAKLVQYADLQPNELGLTRFTPGEPPEISINANLTDSALDSELPEAGMLGRWRATVAHESGHVVLHRVLFDSNPTQMLMFDALPLEEGPRLLRCLKREVGFGAVTSDWREIQANRAMGALLMPTHFFHEIASQQLKHLQLESETLGLESAGARRLTSAIGFRCSVSR